MIETAVQRGSTVYVYGNGNRLLFTKSGDLYGYTSSSVSVKHGSTVYTYNERGALMGTHSAR